MNILRSGDEMLKRVVFIGRFTSLWQPVGSRSRTGTPNPNCRDICALPRLCQRRTSPRLSVNHVRYFCQKEDQAAPQERVTKPLGLQVPASVSQGLSDKGETSVSFRTKLQECRSPSDVLDLAGQYTVTHSRVSNSLTRMWETTKKMPEEHRRYDLQLMAEHPQFEALCHRTRLEAPRMTCDDLAYTLLALTKLGVSHRSLVVQTLLRVVQERLNQFEEKPLSILASCLEGMESGKNVEALKEGLRLLMEDRIPDIHNVMHLQTMMRLMGKDAPPAIRKKLEMKALSMADEFTLPNAQYMLTTLAGIHLNSKTLLDICSKKIAENVHGVPFTRLLAVLKSCRELRYRNHHLLSSISDHLASTLSMWSNKQVMFFLLEFKGLRFRPIALLDALAESVIRNPDSFKLKDLLCVVKTYSSLNHRLKDNQQQFLEAVTNSLESYLPRMSSADLLIAVTSLCVFDHFPPSLLEQLLQKNSLDELLRKGSPSNKGVDLKLHMLDLCLRLDNPPLPATLPPIPPLPGFLAHQERSVNSGLVSALKSLVGEDAVKASVVEENVHFIDCVITLGYKANEVTSGGAPEEQSVSSKPPQRIAVLCAPSSSFCFGTTHPRSSLALKLRHLKLLGYEPVLVPAQDLTTQTHQEMIKMLKNLIFPEKTIQLEPVQV